MENFKQNWTDLLNQAITQPGLILKAYSAFHNYSLGNQLAALLQCMVRQLEPGPINTFNGWRGLNRSVRKGEKAIWLCIPLTGKRQNEQGEDERFITTFIWKPRWFTLCQTEGESVQLQTVPTWDKNLALANLQISQVEFISLNGNIQGYAKKRRAF